MPQGHPAFSRIFHPTDFSPASAVAFGHALKLAQTTGGDLTVFHFARDKDDAAAGAEAFPQVRATLERWKLLPPNSQPADVGALGMSVKKVEVLGDDPMKTILGYLTDRVVDLMVLATHQRTGAARWLRGAVAEPLARETHVLALFVPPDADGFVSFETGAVSLDRILVPVDQTPTPKASIDATLRMVNAFARDTVEVTLLHIGGQDSNPRILMPTDVPGTWTRVVAEGTATDVILEAADELPANLIVMATAGQQGFVDALRGSTTERVIRSARCPVLAVPADIYE